VQEQIGVAGLASPGAITFSHELLRNGTGQPCLVDLPDHRVQDLPELIQSA